MTLLTLFIYVVVICAAGYVIWKYLLPQLHEPIHTIVVLFLILVIVIIVLGFAGIGPGLRLTL